jgi:hypothetical protein
MTESNSTKPKQTGSIKDNIKIPDDRTRLDELIKQTKGISPGEHNNQRFQAPTTPRMTNNYNKKPTPSDQGERE